MATEDGARPETPFCPYRGQESQKHSEWVSQAKFSAEDKWGEGEGQVLSQPVLLHIWWGGGGGGRVDLTFMQKEIFSL